MIHANEICPEFLFTPREDMAQDEELLKQAMDGLKSLEKEAINDLNRAKVRAYKSMIEQAGYEVHTNSTIGDYVETWTLKNVLEAYKKHYPERYMDKKEYSRMDVNNMLFDLCLANVLRGHSQVALPYSIAEDYNNEPFKGWIQVQIIP